MVAALRVACTNLLTCYLLRDIADAAQSYPGTIWPGQIADVLRGLIHAASVARGQGLRAVPDDDIAGDLTPFRRGITAGLSQARRVPGGKNGRQPPALMLLKCLRDREDDVLRFPHRHRHPTHLQPGRT